MSGRKKKAKRKPLKTTTDLPSLTDIYNAFTDARAMITVAFNAIVPKIDGAGEACLVLHLGVKALDRVGDELEEAEMQFDQFLRKSAKGGKS